ncbi:MAG: hypothetical protein CM1200mP20_06380 [Pseudomonadota bacterium]|nr:MAG: hypothetical protein CM1200mP20_06380 [Pseudomonadota bacterium]
MNFTERAFLNAKLDLVQAEAVADLIGSQTQAAVRASLRSLSGELSDILSSISKKIGELRVYIEADIDFLRRACRSPVDDLGPASDWWLYRGTSSECSTRFDPGYSWGGGPASSWPGHPTRASPAS